MSFKTIATFALTALTLVACGGSPDASTEGLGSSESAWTSSGAPVVGEFAHCGGSVRNAPVCATGLKCALGTPIDAGGICVKNGWGLPCGGNSANAPTCQASLECVLNPSRPDVGGTCDYAHYGQACGGNSATAYECGAGLACSHVTASGGYIRPDQPGVCLEGAGQPCGGYTATPKACAGGLTCVGGSPDRTGTCQ
jgi:hypothetical protein